MQICPPYFRTRHPNDRLKPCSTDHRSGGVRRTVQTLRLVKPLKALRLLRLMRVVQAKVMSRRATMMINPSAVKGSLVVMLICKLILLTLLTNSYIVCSCHAVEDQSGQTVSVQETAG